MRKSTVSFLDFQKLDLVVGKVKEAVLVEGSRNLVEMKIELGEEYGVVNILAGIANTYEAKEIVGKKFVFVANLEPKKMLGRRSKGMILAADVAGKPQLIEVESSIPIGSKVR